MGSKKKKQTPKKPVSAAPAVDAVTKKRLDMARKLWRERVRSLNGRNQQNPLLREGRDYDELRAIRRMAASAALLDEVAAVAKPICPEVPEVMDFEYEWMAQNIGARPAFDWNERICAPSWRRPCGCWISCGNTVISLMPASCSHGTSGSLRSWSCQISGTPPTKRMPSMPCPRSSTTATTTAPASGPPTRNS